MTCLSRTLGLILFFSIAAHAQSPIQIEVVGHGGFPLNKTLQPETRCGIRGTFVCHETDEASYATGVSSVRLNIEQNQLVYVWHRVGFVVG